MTVASLGRAKRSEAGIKVRQPLDEVIVGARSRGEKESLERMRSQILDELNVKKLRVDVTISAPTANATAQALPPSVTVELNTNIDQKLADEGMARELVHRLQTMRKQAGFDIADYIYTYYQGGESLKRIIEKHADYIKQETLSRDLITGIPRDAYTESHKIAGEEITLGVKRQG